MRQPMLGPLLGQGIRGPFRIHPAGPAAAYKTYAIKAPLSTHWRPATCAEAACAYYLHGWRTVVDEATDLGQAQAYYIRGDRTRRHREERTPAGLTVFTFEAGQTCFTAHQVRVARPELFIVRSGDWRDNPDGTRRQHTRPEFWVEDFAEHQDRLADRLRQG